MIKIWDDLINDDVTEADERKFILDKLLEQQIHQWGIRLTKGELIKAAKYFDEYSMTFDDKQYNYTKQRFIDNEWGLIQKLINSDFKFDITQIVKTGSQRVERAIEKIKGEWIIEQKIRFLQEEQKTKIEKNTDAAKAWQDLQTIF